MTANFTKAAITISLKKPPSALVIKIPLVGHSFFSALANAGAFLFYSLIFASVVCYNSIR